MALDYRTLKHWPFADVVQTYTEKDTMLYALGVGLGADPMDPAQLRFVYEENLVALPTMAAVLGYPGFWLKDPATGVDWVRLVHAEQRLAVHHPLPAAGTVVGRTRVTGITDKGMGKGALVFSERVLSDQASGRKLATLSQASFCRGDGGYSAGGQPSDPAPAARPAVPDTPPDAVVDLATRPETALIYRLSADPNPLHADPDVARRAGFPRPILHGLATYGVAAHAVLKACCGYDPSRLAEFDVRFSAPMYPGETLRTEIWRCGADLRFRARAIERDVVVLSHGHARVA